MRTEPHGPSLIQLTRLRAINAYLVREDDGFTLVDTLISGSAKGLLEAARAAGAPIVRVTLTHGHADHAGSVDALAELLPDAEFSYPARDARFMRGDKTMDPGEKQSKPLSMQKLSRRADRELQPGDRVGSLEVVAAPGHTPGQIAFLDTRDRTLIAGDAYASLGGLVVTNKPTPRFPLPSLATWDKPLALKTARELRALDPSRLAVGHGRVIEAPGPEMDRALAKAA